MSQGCKDLTRPTPFLCGSADKESACQAGDLGSIPRLGRSPGEGKGYPLQYSGLENSARVLPRLDPGIPSGGQRRRLREIEKEIRKEFCS